MLGRLGASSKKHQEKCTIVYFWGSHGSLTMIGSPVGPFVGLLCQRQIMLHVDLSHTSDQVAVGR